MAGRSTTVGVDRFSSCAPLGGGDSYRVNGPTAVGVSLTGLWCPTVVGVAQ